MNGFSDQKSGTAGSVSTDRLARLLLRNILPTYILNQRYGETLVNNFKQYIEENNRIKDKGQPALQIYQKSIIDNNQFTPSNNSYMGNVNINIFSGALETSESHGNNVDKDEFFKKDEFILSQQEKKYMWLVIDINQQKMVPQQSCENVNDEYLYLLYKYLYEDKPPVIVPKDASGFSFDDVSARYNNYEKLNHNDKRSFGKQSNKCLNQNQKSKGQNTLKLEITPHSKLSKSENKHWYCSSLEMSSASESSLVQDMQKLYKVTDFFKQINFRLPFKFYSLEEQLIMENFKTYVNTNFPLQTPSLNDLTKLIDKETSSSNSKLKNFTYIFNSVDERHKDAANQLNKYTVNCYANSPLLENEIDYYYFEVQLFENNELSKKQSKFADDEPLYVEIGVVPGNTENCDDDGMSSKKTLKQNIEKFCKKVYYHDPVLKKHSDKFDDFVMFMFNEYQRNNYNCYFERFLHDQKVQRLSDENKLDVPNSKVSYDMLNHITYKNGKNLEKELQYIFDYKLFKYKNYFLFENELIHKVLSEEVDETADYSFSEYHSQTDIDWSDQEMSDYHCENEEPVSKGLCFDEVNIESKNNKRKNVGDLSEYDEENDGQEEDMASEVTSSTGRTRPRRKLVSPEKSSKRPSTASLNSQGKSGEESNSNGDILPDGSEMEFSFHNSVSSTKAARAHGKRSLLLPIRSPYRNHIWGQPVKLFQQQKHDDIGKDTHNLSTSTPKKHTGASILAHLGNNTEPSADVLNNQKSTLPQVGNESQRSSSIEYSRFVSQFHGSASTSIGPQEMVTQREVEDHGDGSFEEVEDEDERDTGDADSSMGSDQDDDNENISHDDDDADESDSAEEESVTNSDSTEPGGGRELLTELVSYVSGHSDEPNKLFSEKFQTHLTSKYRNKKSTCFSNIEDEICINTGLLGCKMSDVVGIGINYIDKEVFVTKNGKLLEVIDLKKRHTFDSCIPFVRLTQNNSGVLINYGNFNQKFLFDCDTYFSNKAKQICLSSNKQHKLFPISKQAYYNCNMKNAFPEISTMINNYFVNKQMLRSSNAFMNEVKESTNNDEAQLKTMFGSTHYKYLKRLEFEEFCSTLQGFVNNIKVNGLPLNVEEISDFIVKKFALSQKDLHIEYHLKVFSIQALFIKACADGNPELTNKSLHQSKYVFDKFVKNNETLFSRDWRRVCEIFSTALVASAAELPQLLQNFGREMYNNVIVRLEHLLDIGSTKKFPAVNEALRKYEQSLDKISNGFDEPTSKHSQDDQLQNKKTDSGNQTFNQELEDLGKACKACGLSQILDFYNK
ncbi:hypothetical protein ACO0QE_000887 [Hanseniaspora vineae]